MLFLGRVSCRRRKVEEGNPFENEAFPPQWRDGAPLRGFDPETFEDRLVHRLRVGARVQGELEPPEQGDRVVWALGDQDELLGGVGDPDLDERTRELVVAGDIEGELGAPVSETQFPARACSAEMGPGREEVTLSRHGPGVEESHELRGFLRQLPEGADDRLRRGTTGLRATGADRSDGSFLGRWERGHGRSVTPA